MEIVTRCGMRCDRCPAYLPNRAGADLEKAAAIWAEIFDVHIPDADYERYVRPFENAPFFESCRRGRKTAAEK